VMLQDEEVNERRERVKIKRGEKKKNIIIQ
jgi:hypothetical protein